MSHQCFARFMTLLKCGLTVVSLKCSYLFKLRGMYLSEGSVTRPLGRVGEVELGGHLCGRVLRARVVYAQVGR